MLSLTKKSDAQAESAPQWHPNFRDFERLPDTKVVRTAFFINTAALVLSAVMLLWLGGREYTDYTIRDQINQAKQQIADNEKQNAEAVQLSNLFGIVQKKFAEAQAFIKLPISPVEYFNLLGETLPENVSIDYADSRYNGSSSTVFVLRGRVYGSADQASGIVSNYVDTLRAHQRFSAVFESINLNKINPDTDGKFLAFEISLTVNPKTSGKK